MHVKQTRVIFTHPLPDMIHCHLVGQLAVILAAELEHHAPVALEGQQGLHLLSWHVRPAERTKQETVYGQRGKGYVFDVFRPATDATLTATYESRPVANLTDFLEKVEVWLPTEPERVYAILDNLAANRGVDVLLFALAHERWEFVFQPNAPQWPAPT